MNLESASWVSLGFCFTLVDKVGVCGDLVTHSYGVSRWEYVVHRVQ